MRDEKVDFSNLESSKFAGPLQNDQLLNQDSDFWDYFTTKEAFNPQAGLTADELVEAKGAETFLNKKEEENPDDLDAVDDLEEDPEVAELSVDSEEIKRLILRIQQELAERKALLKDLQNKNKLEKCEDIKSSGANAVNKDATDTNVTDADVSIGDEKTDDKTEPALEQDIITAAPTTEQQTDLLSEQQNDLLPGNQSTLLPEEQAPTQPTKDKIVTTSPEVPSVPENILARHSARRGTVGTGLYVEEFF